MHCGTHRVIHTHTMALNAHIHATFTRTHLMSLKTHIMGPSNSCALILRPLTPIYTPHSCIPIVWPSTLIWWGFGMHAYRYHGPPHQAHSCVPTVWRQTQTVTHSPRPSTHTTFMRTHCMALLVVYTAHSSILISGSENPHIRGTRRVIHTHFMALNTHIRDIHAYSFEVP